jgi:hypothetical protein
VVQPHVPSAAITAPATPAARVTLPLPAPPPSVVSAPAYPVPQSSGHSFPPLDSSSGSYPYPSGSQPSYSMPDVPVQSRQRNWVLIGVVAAAAIVGSLVVWLAMRGSGGSESTADAAEVATITPPPAPVDAVEEEIEIEVPDAQVAASADAYVAPPADAAEVEDLAALMAANRFADAVALCAKQMTAAQVATCTIAACQAKSESKAKQWYAKISGSRRQVTTACRQAGLDLAPKPVVRPPAPRDAGVDPCVVNPANCQGP